MVQVAFLHTASSRHRQLYLQNTWTVHIHEEAGQVDPGYPSHAVEEFPTKVQTYLPVPSQLAYIVQGSYMDVAASLLLARIVPATGPGMSSWLPVWRDPAASRGDALLLSS